MRRQGRKQKPSLGVLGVRYFEYLSDLAVKHSSNIQGNQDNEGGKPGCVTVRGTKSSRLVIKRTKFKASIPVALAW